MKLNKPIAPATWEALGFPPGWGDKQQAILDTIQFVVELPNGIPQEALVAERVGGPGFVATWQLAAVGGQLSYARLLNPGTSGKRVMIDQIVLTSTVMACTLRTGAAAGAAGGTVSNKIVGGAASAVQTFDGAAAAPGGTTMAQLDGDMREITFADPWQLNPGVDFSIVGGSVATGLIASVYFRELDV